MAAATLGMVATLEILPQIFEMETPTAQTHGMVLAAAADEVAAVLQAAVGAEEQPLQAALTEAQVPIMQIVVGLVMVCQAVKLGHALVLA